MPDEISQILLLSDLYMYFLQSSKHRSQQHLLCVSPHNIYKIHKLTSPFYC